MVLVRHEVYNDRGATCGSNVMRSTVTSRHAEGHTGGIWFGPVYATKKNGMGATCCSFHPFVSNSAKPFKGCRPDGSREARRTPVARRPHALCAAHSHIAHVEHTTSQALLLGVTDLFRLDGNVRNRTGLTVVAPTLNLGVAIG